MNKEIVDKMNQITSKTKQINNPYSINIPSTSYLPNAFGHDFLNALSTYPHNNTKTSISSILFAQIDVHNKFTNLNKIIELCDLIWSYMKPVEPTKLIEHYRNWNNMPETMSSETYQKWLQTKIEELNLDDSNNINNGLTLNTFEEFHIKLDVVGSFVSSTHQIWDIHQKKMVDTVININKKGILFGLPIELVSTRIQQTVLYESFAMDKGIVFNDTATITSNDKLLLLTHHVDKYHELEDVGFTEEIHIWLNLTNKKIIGVSLHIMRIAYDTNDDNAVGNCSLANKSSAIALKAAPNSLIIHISE